MLFGKCRKTDGKAVHSVNDQGSVASGKTLIEYLENSEFGGVMKAAFEATGFIDLSIVREHLIASSNNIYNFPRLVTKGTNSGNLTSVRRENAQIFPLVVVSVVQEAVEEEVELDEDIVDQGPEYAEESVEESAE
jgi:hypothetical protein